MRLFWIFLAEFLFSLHFAATLYINSSFLAHFFDLRAVGILYVVGALLSLVLFFLAPRLMNWLGVRKFLLLFVALTLGATVGAAFAHSSIDATFFFLLYAAVSLMVFYALDVLVEEMTTNRKTGQIRGLYLTVMNAAIVLGPVLITFFTVDDTFSMFYLAAAVVLLPIFLFALGFKNKKLHKRPGHSLPLLAWWRKKSLRRVTLSRLILEFFYGMMVIYMPIYLHQNVGFSWHEIGVIFTIMLLPFVIFEWPVGALADKEVSEREIMTLGFGILAISLIFMPYIGHDFGKWAVALFISRVGASFIEITTESYFFKHVDGEDTGLISIFRLTRSVGFILGSAVGALALHLWPFTSIFFILAIAAFLGNRFSKRLVNSK
ncbi:MFS transporter [Candidatus Parcubacteria bacterium]|nr:MFS transporter [Candidatus Parcubacteria bacterium]